MSVLPVLFSLAISGLAHADSREDAIIALAEGRQARAIQLLADGVSTGGEDAQDLRCLLGRVQHQAGRHQDALETLGFVSEQAPCAMGAAWVRAEAMLAVGMEDEAGEVYARLGEEALGPDRDTRTVQRLVDLSDRVLAREEPGSEQAAAALGLALELTVDPQTQLVLARRLADLAAELGRTRVGHGALPVLAAAVDRDGEVEDRRRLASLVGGAAGLAVLEDLPSDLETQLLRLGLGAYRGLGWQLQQLEVLSASHPAAQATRDAQLELGLRLAQDHGWRLEAEGLLEPLAAGQDNAAAQAAEHLARLALDAGDDTLAIERLDGMLARFPHAEQRSWAESSLVQTLWRTALQAAEDGDHARAVALFDRRESEGSGRSAYGAALMARAMGDVDEARRRWEEIPARWPGSGASHDALWALFRLQARDADDPDGALVWLEERAEEGLVDAQWLLTELEDPSLAVDSDGVAQVNGRPAVRVLARGHERLELRLHRVDLEAWMRAGWSLDMLPELDLGIIEPDRSWEVEVPSAHPQRISSFEVPVPVPGPGLYAVTVASPEHEARTLMLYSSTTVVAQRAGPHLAVAVFSGDRPVAGARVLVREGSDLREVSTDAAGLAQLEHAGGSLLVLADAGSGPSLAELDAVVSEPAGVDMLTAVDLDRPVYRPGDRLGFRIAVDRASPSERRDWTLWLDGGAGFTSVVRHGFDEDDDGTVVGEIPLPLGSTGHSGIAAGQRTLTLQARLPDGSQRVLATVRVVDEVPEGRSLDLRTVERTAIFQLREEGGSPAAGVALDWTWTETGLTGRVLTDERGDAQLEGPPAGVPWTLEAALPGTDLTARAWSLPEQASPWSMAGSTDRLRSDESLSLSLEGDGEVELRVQRLTRRQEPGPLADPWGLEPRWLYELEGLERWSGLQALDGRGVRETVHSRSMALDGASSVELPLLEPGRYEAVLARASGEGHEVSWSFTVDDETLRLSAPAAVGAGELLHLSVQGEPALVVLKSSDRVRSMVIRPGQRRTITVPASWRDDVTVVASGRSGASHHRRIVLDPALNLETQVERDAGVWRLRVVATDVAGRPAKAQVVVRAVDLALERRVGRTVSLMAGPMRPGIGWTRAGAWGSTLRFGAVSSPVSAALLAEVAREDEARRAQRALTGQLMDNAVSAVLGEDVPLSLGTRGMGSGGSGYGSGGGSYGGRSSGAKGYGSGAAGPPARPLQGERARVLWAVVDTDERGVVELDMPAPARAGLYRIEVVALSDGWVARSERVLESDGASAGDPIDLEGASTLLALASAVDPHLSHEPGRAAVAARAALAALPLLEGPERDLALDRVRSLLGALSAEPYGYRSVTDAAQVLALLGELDELWTLPRGTIESFEQAIDVQGASRADRVALVWARASAGVAVDDASIARLLREPELLDDEQASQLARALILLERRPEARKLVAGDGPQAVLARRALASRRSERRLGLDAARTLLASPPPAVGSPERPAWIAAVAPVLEGATVGAPVAPVDNPLLGCAQRLPLAADGLPVRAATTAAPNADPPCREGSIALVVGDALRVDGDLSLAVVPPGLERIPDPMGVGFLIRAVAPGNHTVGNIQRDLESVALMVEVGGTEPDGATQAVAIALAREAWAQDRDPSPWLSSRPRLEDWQPQLRAEVARLRFAVGVRDEIPAAQLVAAFEDLRDVDPRGVVGFDEVLATARAYRSLRPRRSMEIQRAAIGAAFLDEAAIAARLEQVLGPLAAIQVLWEIAGRYPAVPVVEQALYELPDRVLDMGIGGTVPPELRKVGVTPTDLRLMSAAWNREFIALHPDSGLAPSAGRRLVVDLLHLGAWDRAAGWASRMTAWHPRHELSDSFLYLEGLARSAAGDHRGAAAMLRKVSKQRFVQPDGLDGPSELTADAELALARLLEARGDRAGAVAAYAEAAGELEEAQASVLQLNHRAFELDRLVLLEPGEPAVLPVTVAGVDRVFLRAYRLDLRTLFLRDSGLDGVEDVVVAGISPAWSGERAVKERPFAKEHELRLPLGEAGAWLVQLHAGGQARTAVLVRSELELSATDAGAVRRVTVLRRGRPAAGVQVRAIASGHVVAAVTDQRGVAMVPAYAPTLAFDGAHYAFTRSHQAGAATLSFDGGDELLRRVDERLEVVREQQRVRALHIGVQGSGGLEASKL